MSAAVYNRRYVRSGGTAVQPVATNVTGAHAPNAALGNLLTALAAEGLVTDSTTTTAVPAVTGSKGSNAALTSLIAALVTYGFITDSTS